MKPFDGARSEHTLRKWLDEIGSHDYVLTNVSNVVTPGNRPLRVSEMDLEGLRETILKLEPQHVIALGRIAERALKALELTCIPMPHPSGLNRKLNDQLYVQDMLESVRRWIRDEADVYREPIDHESETDLAKALRAGFGRFLASLR